MRSSDWSSDACSSDLLSYDSAPSLKRPRDRHEAAFLLVEIEEVRLVWHAHQAAVVAVDPVVVIAGEARGAAALGQHHLIAAMGADIVERLNSVIAAARHHDRRVPDLDGLGEEAALFGKLF